MQNIYKRNSERGKINFDLRQSLFNRERRSLSSSKKGIKKEGELVRGKWNDYFKQMATGVNLKKKSKEKCPKIRMSLFNMAETPRKIRKPYFNEHPSSREAKANKIFSKMRNRNSYRRSNGNLSSSKKEKISSSMYKLFSNRKEMMKKSSSYVKDRSSLRKKKEYVHLRTFLDMEQSQITRTSRSGCFKKKKYGDNIRSRVFTQGDCNVSGRSGRVFDKMFEAGENAPILNLNILKTS